MVQIALSFLDFGLAIAGLHLFAQQFHGIAVQHRVIYIA